MKHSVIGSLGILSALVSGQALANWEVGVNYNRLSENITVMENIEYGLDLDVLTVSLGYEFEVARDLYIVPEISIGDSVENQAQIYQDFTVDTPEMTATLNSTISELEHFFQFALRLEHKFDTGVYAYIVPSYANVATDSTLRFAELSLIDQAPQTDLVLDREVDEWHFGLGMGFGYQVSEELSAEVSYQNFDEVEIIRIGAKYAF